MYKVQCGKDLTKYFLTYSEASKFCKAVGFPTRKIKSVN